MTLTAGATGWVEWAATGTPIPGETSSGDGHLVVRGALRTLIAVMDGLGHGPEAHRATTAAIAAITEIPDAPLRSMFAHCDGALRQTRGVVMTIASIAGDGQMEWMGVGNVEAIVVRFGRTVPPRDNSDPWRRRRIPPAVSLPGRDSPGCR